MLWLNWLDFPLEHHAIYETFWEICKWPISCLEVLLFKSWVDCWVIQHFVHYLISFLLSLLWAPSPINKYLPQIKHIGVFHLLCGCTLIPYYFITVRLISARNVKINLWLIGLALSGGHLPDFVDLKWLWEGNTFVGHGGLRFYHAITEKTLEFLNADYERWGVICVRHVGLHAAFSALLVQWVTFLGFVPRLAVPKHP